MSCLLYVQSLLSLSLDTPRFYESWTGDWPQPFLGGYTANEVSIKTGWIPITGKENVALVRFLHKLKQNGGRMRILKHTHITLLLSLLALLLAMPAAAEFISPADAVQAARTWISGRYGQEKIAVASPAIQGFRNGTFSNCPADLDKAGETLPQALSGQFWRGWLCPGFRRR